VSNYAIGMKAVLTGLLQLSAAMVGGAPLVAAAAQGANVQICHIPPDNPGAARFISVAAAAVSKHTAHGDEALPGNGACSVGVGECRVDASLICTGDGLECDATPIAPPEEHESSCNDGKDNDCDGLIDDQDPDCAPAPATCFSFTNTDAEDLPGGAAGAGWFDHCVDGQTTQIAVTLRDPAGTIVYQATGTKAGTWTVDQLTSTADAWSQSALQNHDRVIALENGDQLRISGRDAADAGCGGDLGNGYVIVIYGASHSGNYYEDIKMLVAPYQRTFEGFGVGPREFSPWTAGAEISWNGGVSDMNSCAGDSGGSPLVGFHGTFEVEVF
jgi:hypothetical protein